MNNDEEENTRWDGAVLLLIAGMALAGIILWVVLSEKAAVEQHTEQQQWQQRAIKYQLEDMRSLNYFQDTVTGLCFAVTGAGNSSAIANVDCTGLEDVLVELNKEVK